MVELGGASILGVDRKVYSYRPHDPIALAHAPEVLFRRLGRPRRPCVSSPCPQGFEPARRSTAPCRWRRAIERRLPPCSADEPPRRERHRCRVHLTVHLGERQDPRPPRPAAHWDVPFGVTGVFFRGRTPKRPPGQDASGAVECWRNGCEEKVTFGVILVHSPFTPARLMLMAAVLPFKRGDHLAPARRGRRSR